MSVPTFFANHTSINCGPMMMRLTFVDVFNPNGDGEPRTEVLMVRSDAVAMAKAVIDIESRMNLAQQPVVGSEQ